jgi:hypothetical protein
MSNTRIKLTGSQRSAVEIYVTDPAVLAFATEIEGSAPSFDLDGNILTILTDWQTACSELIEAANSADIDGPGAGGKALMNLCRRVRVLSQVTS